MKFNKTLIAISLASALSACGSSSSDPKDTTAPLLLFQEIQALPLT